MPCFCGFSFIAYYFSPFNAPTCSMFIEFSGVVNINMAMQGVEILPWLELWPYAKML